MIYHVKSLQKNGTYFGRFKSLEDAQEAADKAVLEEKYGATDWEPEEKDMPGLDAMLDKDMPGLDAIADKSVDKGRYTKKLVESLHEAFNQLSRAAGIANQDGRSAVYSTIVAARDTLQKVITAWNR